MTENLVITQANLQDVPSLVKLLNSAYRGDASKKGWTTEADLLKGPSRTDATMLEAAMREPDSVFLTCRDANSILGCVYLQKQKNRLYLGMFAVSPNMQAKGIGKQLLAAADMHARDLHCKSIYMTVISIRKELIGWYERHGYKKTGETKPFPVDERFGIPQQKLELIVLEK